MALDAWMWARKAKGEAAIREACAGRKATSGLRNWPPAWRILYLMTLGRDCPQLPCEVAFAPEEWRTAWLVAHRQPPPATPPTLGTMIRLLAGFGGFLGRKGDGHPGPKAFSGRR